MTPKLTEWLDGSKFVPAHVGVYERDINPKWLDFVTVYSYWDGKRFSIWSTAIELAYMRRHERSRFQKASWRGLAVKP